MNIILEKIGANAKIAFQNKINNKKKNQVLNDYIKLILKNQNNKGFLTEKIILTE